MGLVYIMSENRIPENTIIGCANMAAKNISQYEYMDFSTYKSNPAFMTALTALQAFETDFKEVAISDLDPKKYALSRLFSKMDSFTKEGDDARGAAIYGQDIKLTYDNLNGNVSSGTANTHWEAAVKYEKDRYLPYFFYRTPEERKQDEFVKTNPGSGRQIIIDEESRVNKMPITAEGNSEEANQLLVSAKTKAEEALVVNRDSYKTEDNKAEYIAYCHNLRVEAIAKLETFDKLCSAVIAEIKKIDGETAPIDFEFSKKITMMANLINALSQNGTIPLIWGLVEFSDLEQEFDNFKLALGEKFKVIKNGIQGDMTVVVVTEKIDIVLGESTNTGSYFKITVNGMPLEVLHLPSVGADKAYIENTAAIQIGDFNFTPPLKYKLPSDKLVDHTPYNGDPTTKKDTKNKRSELQTQFGKVNKENDARKQFVLLPEAYQSAGLTPYMFTFPSGVPTRIEGDDIIIAPNGDISIDHYPFAVIPQQYFEGDGHLKGFPVKSYAAEAKGGRKQSRKYRRRNNKNTKKRQRRSKRNKIK